jgi:preprotein translocase subunit SecG
MQIWMTLILAVQLLSALAMIGLVLIQHGSLFGASGSANFLSRSTAALATVFFITTLALAYLGTSGKRGETSGNSILDRVAPAASAPAASAVPGAAPAVPPPALQSAVPGAIAASAASTAASAVSSAASAAMGVNNAVSTAVPAAVPAAIAAAASGAVSGPASAASK